MKIFGIQTVGVRGVADGEHGFARTAEEPHDRILVTGPASSGKTRFLELIAACREKLAPSDERINQDALIRSGNHTAKAIVRFWLEEDERRTVGAPGPIVDTEVIFGVDDIEPDPSIVYLLSAYGHDDRTPKLEYWSERRRLDVGGGEMSLEPSHQHGFRSIDSPRKFAFLPAFLDRLAREPAQAARLSRSLEGLSRSLRYDTERHSLLSGSRVVDALSQLSASEADGLMFAATATLVGLSRSVLLVDRPELHGLDAVRAHGGLCALGEGNQVICATSSPELLAAFQGLVIALPENGQRF